MDVHLREPIFDVPEQFLIPLERECGMEPTLHEDLIAAQGHRLLDLREQHVPVEYVALGMFRAPVEGAEVANRRADVRVVDVAVDVVGAIRLRMESHRHRMGRPTDRRQVARPQEQCGIGGRKSAARERGIQNPPHGQGIGC